MSDARFYFANLTSDVARCARAALNGNEKRYGESLSRAHKTLMFLRDTGRPEAYEEGLLLLEGLRHAKEEGVLTAFSAQVDTLATQYSPISP